MSEFIPVNSIEIILRKLRSDPNTPYWSFYTPLAAAPLWIIVRNYPELDGSKRVAPKGQNPDICTFQGPEGTYVGIYTSAMRAQAAMERWKISPREMTITSAQGYELLSFLQPMDYDLYINFGLPECQYGLDPDMVDILLSRPKPPKHATPARRVAFKPDIDPSRHLGPLLDFLRKQPNLRAAWIFGHEPEAHLPPHTSAFELSLLMQDPEDKSLLDQATLMVNALSPISMEWTTSVMAADDQSLRNLAAKHPPYYQRRDFLQDS